VARSAVVSTARQQWDNQQFRETILPHLHRDAQVLDLGAGSGLVRETHFRGLVARVCGLDPDERVLQNPHLDEAHMGMGEAIPHPDATFDVVFANNVLEHLDHPQIVFREIARVLKPGGRFFAKTPNRWHYVPLIAAWTPHWFHQAINQHRGRQRSDTFPTCYLANSPRTIRRLADAACLQVNQVTLIEGRPEYLRFNAATYLAGWCYERCVNRLPGLSNFRVVLMIELSKPGGRSLAPQDDRHTHAATIPWRATQAAAQGRVQEKCYQTSVGQ
jgi:SAM-dependent methyltransferase